MKLSKTKTHLKELAANIRTTRQNFRSAQRGSIPAETLSTPMWKTPMHLASLAYEFRHKHIAYCLLRGRTYEEIENKVLPDNSPNWEVVEAYKTEFAKEAQESEVPLATGT